MLLSELLTPERVKVPLSGRSKDDVLSELVALAMPSASASDTESILESVRARERQASTAMGEGVAIPHGRTSLLTELVIAAGIAPAAVDYGAPDGEPVNLFFLLVGPESAGGAHVKALARIARLLRRASLRGELRAVQTPADFMALVRTSEAV